MNAAVKVVGPGLACSVLGGVYMALALENLWVGVAVGAVSAVVLTLALWGTKGLAGLTFDQRQHVLQSLRQGRAMDDHQLWAAHWHCGSGVLARPHSPAVANTFLAFMAVFYAANLYTDLVENGPGTLLNNLPMTVFPLGAIFVLVPWVTRYREQVARSMNATDAVVRQQQLV